MGTDALVDDQKDIARWIGAQRGPLRIAVAFWGAQAIELLGLSAAPKDTRILLDLSAGATNPSEVRRLMALFPGGVLASHRLHAKAWIGANDMIVGSANASANGLGAEGSESLHWKELGARVSDPKVLAEATAWFDRLWADGSQIKSSDLAEAEAAWQQRRRYRPVPRAAKSLLEAAIASPEDFAERRIFVVVSAEELSDEATATLNAQSEAENTPVYAFEDWPKIPIEATLICFDSVGGKITIDEEAPICSTNAQTAKRGKLRYVFKEDTVHGLPLGKTTDWIKRIQSYAMKNPKKWGDGDICVELTDFIARSA